MPPSPARSGERVVFDCPIGAIHPRNGPFCYALPNGFTDFSKETDYGQGWDYRSLISLSASDDIQVLAAQYPVDLETLSPAQRRTYFDQQRPTVGEDGLVGATKLVPTSVDGAEAYAQDLAYNYHVTVHAVTVLRGHFLVSIYCDRGTDGFADRLDRGCAEVLSTIQIVDS